MAWIGSSDLRQIYTEIQLVLKNQGKIMAAIDDLKTAVAALKVSVSNELAAVIAKLSAPNANDADIQAAVADLNTLKANLDSETTTLSS